MARLNVVNIYGYLMDNPKININTDGEATMGRFPIQIVRRFNEEYRNSSEFSCPVILTKEKRFANLMTTLSKNDFVMIKGSVNTVNINRKWICSCGAMNIQSGMQTFITPIEIKKQELISKYIPGEDKEADRDAACLKFLNEFNEFSNNVMLIGTVCKTTPFYSEDGKMAFSFQIACKRSYKLVNGDPDIKTDYPWIKVYGEKAKTASEYLDINSTVCINGSYFTKNVNRICHCEQCGEPNEISDIVSEIHPYSIEYLHNCNLPKEEDYYEYIPPEDDNFDI